jgi:hypothetical protein
MVARINAHATIPLDRATYQGIWLIGQLPLVVVCEVTLAELDPVELLDALVLVEPEVAAVAEVESSDSDDPSVPEVFDDEVVLLVLAAALWAAVVLVTPSCHANTPPSDSIAVTLSAVAALRARAARGLRRVRPAPTRVRAEGVVVGSCSFMTATVRIGGERSSRGE